MAFDPHAYGAGGPLREWSYTKIVDISDWDQDTLLLLFGIPSWSIDAELILMNWGRYDARNNDARLYKKALQNA